MSKNRNWCFTSFDIPNVMFAGVPMDRVRYYVCGFETSPTTGRTHYQGFIVFKSPRTLESVKTFFGDRGLHLEPKRGTFTQASVYCKKDGKFVEFGDLPQDGATSARLSEIGERIIQGENLREIAVEDPVLLIRHGAGLSRLVSLMEAPAFRKDQKVTILWGPAGSGKTSAVYEKYGIEQIYSVPIRNGIAEFNLYNKQPVLLIDDFTPNMLPRQWVLNLLDGYPMQVRGLYYSGYLPADVKEIIITTNFQPEELYRFRSNNNNTDFLLNNNDESTLDQAFLRRITARFHITAPNCPDRENYLAWNKEQGTQGNT